MLNRGIIDAVEDGMLIVRVPQFDKSSSAVGRTNPSVRCSYISMPGIKPKYRVGDVVFIGHEGTVPVVLGTIGTVESSSTTDINIDSLNVNVNANLPKDTNIGMVNGQNLSSLTNAPINIMSDLAELRDSNKQMQELINDLRKEIELLKGGT